MAKDTDYDIELEEQGDPCVFVKVDCDGNPVLDIRTTGLFFLGYHTGKPEKVKVSCYNRSNNSRLLNREMLDKPELAGIDKIVDELLSQGTETKEQIFYISKGGDPLVVFKCDNDGKPIYQDHSIVSFGNQTNGKSQEELKVLYLGAKDGLDVRAYETIQDLPHLVSNHIMETFRDFILSLRGIHDIGRGGN